MSYERVLADDPTVKSTQASEPVVEEPVIERPAPTAGRLVRLRARLARSQSALGRGLLSVLSRDHLEEEDWGAPEALAAD